MKSAVLRTGTVGRTIGTRLVGLGHDVAMGDLGDLTAARGMEMYLPLSVRLRGVTQTGDFNIRVVR
ncbi:MAG TPA: hypothetical protein VK926_09315 [Gaiellaceae bacterium]|nr:hypothetical protein [Gaiellaceae bacterium]